jgi:hypothetical protein
MNDEVKKKWINALVNGGYAQGEGQLRKENQYCCLGVLCDIYKENTGKGEWINPNSTDGRSSLREFQYEDSDGVKMSAGAVLPRPVKEWAGLESNHPFVPKLGTSLTKLNDNDEHDFTDIAAIIRDEL